MNRDAVSSPHSQKRLPLEMRISALPFWTPEARTRSVLTRGLINVGDRNDPDRVGSARDEDHHHSTSTIPMVEKVSEKPDKMKLITKARVKDLMITDAACS